MQFKVVQGERNCQKFSLNEKCFIKLDSKYGMANKNLITFFLIIQFTVSITIPIV